MNGRLPCRSRAAGLSLVELMVSLLVGLIVVLAATSLLLSVQRSHAVQDDLLRLDENARFALEVLARTVRHAGFAAPDDAAAPPASAAVLGIDAASLARNSEGIADPQPSGVNASDVLAIRHAASGPFAVPNCAGFRGTAAGEARASWSIFYVARDAEGEPQLYCKYEGEHGWNADAIVAGVEGFQVLYGIDGDGDGLPDRLLSAAALGPPDATAAWRQVVMIRIAMLLRGQSRGEATRVDEVHDLFGPAYGAEHASEDAGVRLSEAELSGQSGARMRRVVQATVYLRNAEAGRVR